MAPTPESLQLIKQLAAKLDTRAAECALRDAYYDGEHPLPWGAGNAKVVAAYRELVEAARSNWCELVVDAVEERLEVVGFRFGEGSATDDLDVWSGIWQPNGLDAGQVEVHRETLIHGVCPVLVWPGPEGAPPSITAEDPRQTIVAYDTRARRRRVAALKRWTEDGGSTVWVLYLPDRVEWWRSATDAVEKAELDRENSGPNPLGVVPIVELENKSRVGRPPRGELTTTVLRIQDRINRTLFNRLLAAEFSAFRQRWVTGMEIPSDPETGQPIEPFKAAVDRLWMAEDPDVKFGEFGEANLQGYIRSIEADVQHLAAITHTPPHYVLGNMVNISGDALKAAEAGLVAKVRRRQTTLGERWEEIIRLALRAIGDQRADDTSCSVVWRDPEYRTEGELVDALVKMAGLGVPREVLWARWGAAPNDIARWSNTPPADPPAPTDPPADPTGGL